MTRASQVDAVHASPEAPMSSQRPAGSHGRVPVASSCLGRYGVAVLATAAALLCRLALDAVLEDRAVFLLSILALLVSAWYGGLGPSLLATGLSASVIGFALLEPRWTPTVDLLADGLSLVVFVVVGLGMGALVAQLHRAHQALEQRVVERTSQLTAVNEALIKEITEREQVEEQLRRSEAYLAEGQRISHTGTWAVKFPSEDVFWSQEVYHIYGLDPAAMKLSQQMAFQLIHPEDRPLVKVAFERALRENSDYVVEHRAILPDGSIKYLHALGHPVLNESGTLTEYVGTVMDITERKRAEELLRKTHERVEMILDSITDQFFALDSDWRFTYLNNHAAEQMKVLGKEPARLIGSVLWEEFPDVPNEAALRRVMSERVMITDELYYPPLGEWVENHMYPSPDGGIATFQRYITARKRAEEEVRRAYEALEQQVQERTASLARRNQELLALYEQVERERTLKATLLKELNHRVRNNLAAIIGIVEVERERAHLRTADEALAACAAWLTAIARAHDLLVVGAFAPMDLRDFIAVIAAGIMRQAGDGVPQITIVYDEAALKLPSKPFLALACITNELILNAVKHAFQGRERGRIEIRAWEDGERYVLEVCDDGVGFPAGAETVGTGLEIVTTLCSTDLRGDCCFLHNGGTIARITFPKAVAAAGAES